MKNKIIIISLVLLITFGLSINVYADEVEYVPFEWVEETATTYVFSGKYPTLTVFDVLYMTDAYYEPLFPDFVDTNCYFYINNASNGAYFYYQIMPKGTVSVPVYMFDSSGVPVYHLYTYYLKDGSLVRVPQYYISFMANNYLKAEPSKNVAYYTPEGLETMGYLGYCNQPLAEDENCALNYLLTGDVTYLTNPEVAIEVPCPQNVSTYLASEENALYVYYENVDFAYSSDVITRLHGNYRYRNADGEDIVVSAIPQVDVEYVKRGQIKVDLSVLDEFDTGNVFIFLNNVWNDSVDSDWIGIEYRKGSNSYYIVDIIDGEASNLKEVVITDYGNINNSYTGGTVGNITTNIPSAGQGDYSFLGGLFNGFGLLGDNGLIALLTQTFSYVPKEIFVMIGAGISAGIGVVLIKWLFD